MHMNDRNNGFQDQYGWTVYGRRPGMERPDEEIRSEVLETLINNPYIDPSNIQVYVNDGVVMLSGVVDTEEAWQVAEEDVWDIPGIVDVHNELQIMQMNVRLINERF